MNEAKFEIGDNALMMYDDRPVKAIVIQRLFTQRERISRFSGSIDVDEYTEYVVCLRSGLEKRVHENKLFRTREELFESFGL